MGLLTINAPVRMWTPIILRAQGRSETLISVGLVIGALFCLAVLSGCVNEDDLTTDQRVYQLSTQLMCPVCDGQTLDQSQAQLSLDMQKVIQQKVEEGESNTDIRAYFVERYGEAVLASPDAGGFNFVAWVMPAVIFVGGALLVGNAFLNMRRQKRTNDEDSDRDKGAEIEEVDSSDVDGEMDEYLERADREIAAAIGDSGLKDRDQIDAEDNR